jgi:hypothetical protein
MHKTLALSALLLGSTLLTATPSEAAPPRAHWHHIIARHPHARFVLRHDFRHFTPAEHRWWTGGRWRHTRWHGRFGWWWNVGPSWYFYDAPVYPYPSDVSPTYYDDENYDDQDQGAYDEQNGPGDQYEGDQQDMGPGYGGGGPGVWYHCASPEGYYPYVKECRNGWEQVPANPNDMRPGPQGGASQGYQGGDQGDQDQGDDQDDQGPPPPSSPRG